jgi:hypothetical protein
VASSGPPSWPSGARPRWPPERPQQRWQARPVPNPTPQLQRRPRWTCTMPRGSPPRGPPSPCTPTRPRCSAACQAAGNWPPTPGTTCAAPHCGAPTCWSPATRSTPPGPTPASRPRGWRSSATSPSSPRPATRPPAPSGTCTGGPTPRTPPASPASTATPPGPQHPLAGLHQAAARPDPGP